MNKLVELGFQARRNFQEDQEIKIFKEWCVKNHLKQDDTLRAEVLWEMNISKFKSKEHNKVFNK